MKKCLVVYQNNVRLLGTDFSRVLADNLGQRAINNRMTAFKQQVKNLESIKPFLKNSPLDFRIEPLY